MNFYQSWSGNFSDNTDRDIKFTIDYTTIKEVQVSVTGVTVNEHTVKVEADGTNLTITVDEGEPGVITDTTLLSGASVINSDNSWAFAENDVMPYIDYIKFITAIGGVSQKLWYQPVTIIQSTAAVDRSGAGNHGVITWGTNPADIEITVSSAISAIDYFATTGGASVEDSLPIPSGFNMTAINATGIATFWLYDLVNRAALSLGFSAQTMYVIIGLIAATGVGFGALIGTGNMLGFAIGFGATAALFAATGVMPWWVIIIIVSIVGMGIYTWRRG